MASTLVSLLVHFVFSTKDRQPLILPAIEDPLYRYIRGIVDGDGSKLLAIGGTSDHLHLAVSLGKRTGVVDLMEEVKRDSSKWIKTQGKAFSNFYWQQGYGAFSIGQSGLEALKAYIATQKEHHRRRSFQDEFRRLLRKYDIEWDERYVWG